MSITFLKIFLISAGGSCAPPALLILIEFYNLYRALFCAETAACTFSIINFCNIIFKNYCLARTVPCAKTAAYATGCASVFNLLASCH